jgi:hypothetical protein
MNDENLYLPLRQATEAEDRADAPATAEETQAQLSRWFIHFCIFVIALCGLAAALFN